MAKMARPRSIQWWRVPIEELKRIPGVGPGLITKLSEHGYEYVHQVYGDSSMAWGNLERVDGISRHTAIHFLEDIERWIPKKYPPGVEVSR